MQKFTDETKVLADKLFSKRNQLKNEIMIKLKQDSPQKGLSDIEAEAEDIMKSPEALALWNSTNKPKPIGRFIK
jgi:hypothetical protein